MSNRTKIVQNRINYGLFLKQIWTKSIPKVAPNLDKFNKIRCLTLFFRRLYASTGCPAKLYLHLFFEFLSFLRVWKFHLGYLSTALYVEFENINFFINWSNLYWDICKLIQKGHFKSYHFVILLRSHCTMTAHDSTRKKI